MDGIVYEIVGEQRPETIAKLGGVGVMGGNADFKIVFTGERAHLSTVPEALVLGSCQWRIEDGIASAAEIKLALDSAEVKRKTDEAEQLRQNNERIDKRAALPKLYPWLKVADGKISTHALGAANLKTELQRQFPGVKFSVKSEAYAGGDAIANDQVYLPMTWRYETKASLQLWDIFQQCNRALGADFWEGIVAKRNDSIYPRQRRNVEMDWTSAASVTSSSRCRMRSGAFILTCIFLATATSSPEKKILDFKFPAGVH